MVDWEEIFRVAAGNFQNRKYDVHGLTKSKVENLLTSLLQTELSILNPELAFYCEVPERQIYSTSKSENKLDLLAFKALQSIASQPCLYSEFKFLYTGDIKDSFRTSRKSNKRDGQMSNIADTRKFEEDLSRLVKFKRANPSTTCIQGFYVCANTGHHYENSPKDFPNRRFEHFVRDYSTSVWLAKRKILTLSDASTESSEEFWLKLVLFEVVA